MNRLKIAKSNQDGAILVAVIVVTFVITIIGFSLVSYGLSHLSVVHSNVHLANATQTAEAGIEQSLYQLNIDDDFSGYTTEQVFFDNSEQGRGVFTTTVENLSGDNAKLITSTGKVYRQSDLSSPVNTRIIRATAVGTGSEGYSVHTGVGA